MSAMIKVDAAMVHKYLGLDATQPIHVDKMGVLLQGEWDTEKGSGIVVNQRITVQLPKLTVRRYFAIIVPNPDLHQFASITGTQAIPPELGEITPVLHLTGLRKGDLAEVPWMALVYLID